MQIVIPADHDYRILTWDADKSVTVSHCNGIAAVCNVTNRAIADRAQECAAGKAVNARPTAILGQLMAVGCADDNKVAFDGNARAEFVRVSRSRFVDESAEIIVAELDRPTAAIEVRCGCRRADHLAVAVHRNGRPIL